MENQIVTHITQNGRYRLVLERAASTKGVDGFKIEANGDDIDCVRKDALTLFQIAQGITAPTAKGE